MNEKDINITIVHTSDIILYGLCNIIEKCCINNVVSVKNIYDIPDYPNILGYNLLILPKSVYEKNIELLNRVYKNASQLNYLLINNNSSIYKHEYINIDDSSSNICLKINDILKSYNLNSLKKKHSKLSLRETDILKLIAKGLTNKEIANELFISPHTVITHRKNITEKLNIKSISGLTVYAVIKKIINIEDISTDELI